MSMYPQGNVLDYGYAETGERSKLLTKFFHNVYLWMGIALVWTAIVSFIGATSPALRPMMMSKGVIFTAMIGAFLVSLATQAVALRINVVAGLFMFMLYSTLIGVMIAPIWLIYRQSTIGAAFALTGGTFVAMSFVGMITKMDLSKLHSILIMGAIGLFIASLVNIFVASNALSWLVTYAVVIIFTGLIATQTQRLKEFAIENGDNATMAGRVAVIGALTLYIAFINLFLAILRILGDRK